MNIPIIKIKKYLLLLLCICLNMLSASIHAQAPPQKPPIRQAAMERLQEAKWGFIIYRLNLEEARSNKLLPIYKSYENEKKAIIMSSAEQFKSNREPMDDRQAEAFMDARIANAQKLLDLKEKYKPQFLSVLSPKELLTMQNAEQDFAVKVMMERRKRRQERMNN